VITGEQHARQRRLVTPIFGVPHLRQLVPVFYQAAEKVCLHFVYRYSSVFNRRFFSSPT
jgi:cytochrome P450